MNSKLVFLFQGFCFAIFLVKKLTSDTLLSRLKQFGNRHADHTRALSKPVFMQFFYIDYMLNVHAKYVS